VDWIEVVSSGGSLPASVELEDLPRESLAEGIGFWEPLEGMRVSVRDGLVVSPTSRYGEFALLTKADARPGSGFYPKTKQIFLRPLGENNVDYNPERILAARRRGEEAVARPGDRVVELMGIVDYTFGNYKVIPSRLELETRGPPELPVSARTGSAGDTAITTFNVENLFDLEDDPEKDDEGNTPSLEELETKLRKLAMAIRIELELPDILVVQEVENTAILARLADRINRESRTSYVAASRGSSDPRGIENGFLWDSNRVKLREAFLLPGPEVERSFGREPLVGVFEIRGRELIIIGNHFKSKAGDDPLYGVNDPPLRSTEIRRKAQARAVRKYVNSISERNADAWVMVAGDLNDFPFGEPGEGPDHPLAILEGRSGEAPLENLVLREDPAESYTFIYQGNSQIVDYILVSPSLLNVYAGLTILHFNAAQPAGSSWNPTTPLRSSDHDAVEARFRMKED
jgi:predicted extracellular nuclease